MLRLNLGSLLAVKGFYGTIADSGVKEVESQIDGMLEHLNCLFERRALNGDTAYPDPGHFKASFAQVYHAASI
jgi:hypothetical protein